MRAARVVFALLAALALPAVQAETCCAVCLGTLGPATYDVTDFNQCSGKQPGCCFNCAPDATISSPAFQATMAAGTWQTVTWSEPTKVTKVDLVGTASTAAHPRPQPKGVQVEKDAKGNYILCLDSAGVILFRGFGKDPTGAACQQMSSELSITVTAGAAGATCASKKPTSSGSGSSAGGGNSTAKPKVTDPPCNLQRGFVNKDNVCECTSDYSGPPECSGQATWKLLVSIAGGVAALFSIAISVRQFMLFRKRKEEERLLATQQERASKDEVEVMAISSGPDYYDAKRTPNNGQNQRAAATKSPVPMKPYPVDSHHNMSPRQSREYTL
ncbi:hypothetical protein SPRG_19334 [Saprolegnia parasitica CBS 223.65]|uniref:EGF-like domain-containing protein n=1 Tax=Saprolegnia parasitica (strain CBS 223.65) TaxID=695850 RepID=A0A067CWW6_SAPPC|nr:hypothetical protein SPRG_19334 [Saprolegnia parasitica CBS 223.65]KDO33725.1 hypothetical protein SPRG_19334 [Saprolegnia parasitica CBS 223.65]|eukprot:XP_012195745.1 hypothetical protein SPRG_19334 [Saprolegnia parasitica CBS 223.65]